MMVDTRKVAVFIVLLSFLCAITPISLALQVKGVVFKADVSPGEHIGHLITVSSDENSAPMDLVVELGGFGQTLGAGSVALGEEEDDSPYSARSFLEINPTSFHLEPGESQEVIVEGIVPNDVDSGGRYALVTFRSGPVASDGNVGIAVGANVPVFLTISGTDQMTTGEITDLGMEEPVSANSPRAYLIFKNTGNYHFKSLVKAELTDSYGDVIAEMTTPLSSSLIPPNSRRFDVTFNPSTELEPGTYSVTATVEMEDGTVLDSEETEFEV